MKSRVEDARARFFAGFNCAQAVFATYADLFGMDEATALRVSAGLGGGMGRLREVCGALSSCSMLAGLQYGATQGKDAAAKKRTYEEVQRLAARFREENGAIVCRELLGLSRAENDPVPEARTPAYYKKRPCPDIIAGAAQMLEDTLFAGRFSSEGD